MDIIDDQIKILKQVIIDLGAQSNPLNINLTSSFFLDIKSFQQYMNTKEDQLQLSNLVKNQNLIHNSIYKIQNNSGYEVSYEMVNDPLINFKSYINYTTQNKPSEKNMKNHFSSRNQKRKTIKMVENDYQTEFQSKQQLIIKNQMPPSDKIKQVLGNKEDKDLVIEDESNEIMQDRNEKINRLVFKLNGQILPPLNISKIGSKINTFKNGQKILLIGQIRNRRKYVTISSSIIIRNYCEYDMEFKIIDDQAQIYQIKSYDYCPVPYDKVNSKVKFRIRKQSDNQTFSNYLRDDEWSQDIDLQQILQDRIYEIQIQDKWCKLNLKINHVNQIEILPIFTIKNLLPIILFVQVMSKDLTYGQTLQIEPNNTFNFHFTNSSVNQVIVRFKIGEFNWSQKLNLWYVNSFNQMVYLDKVPIYDTNKICLHLQIDHEINDSIITRKFQVYLPQLIQNQTPFQLNFLDQNQQSLAFQIQNNILFCDVGNIYIQQENDIDNPVLVQTNLNEINELDIKTNQGYVQISLKKYVQILDFDRQISQKVIQIFPRIIVENLTKFKLQLKMQESIKTIDQTQKDVLFFPIKDNRLTCINFVNQQLEWSYPINMMVQGTQSIALHNTNMQPSFFKLEGEYDQNHGVLFVKVCSTQKGSECYIIDNQLKNIGVNYFQKSFEKYSTLLKAQSRQEFAWKSVTQDKILQLQFEKDGQIFYILLDQLSYKQQIDIGAIKIQLKLTFINCVKTLIITQKQLKQPNQIIQNSTRLLLKIDIPELSFSVIRNQKYINKEIILIKLTELEFGLHETLKNKIFQLRIGNFVIQNQDQEFINYPFILYFDDKIQQQINTNQQSQIIESQQYQQNDQMLDQDQNNEKNISINNGQNDKLNQDLNNQINKHDQIKQELDKDDKKSKPIFDIIIDQKTQVDEQILYLNSLYLEIQPFTLNLEEQLLTDIQQMTTELELMQTNAKDYFKKILQNNFVLKSNDLNLQHQQFIYIDNLEIHQIKMKFSFKSTKDKQESVPDQNNLKIGSFVQDFLGFILINISDATIYLHQTQQKNVLIVKDQIIDFLKSIYLDDELKLQMMKLIGSADIFGIPVQFISNLQQGVKDLYNKPKEGFKQGPLEGLKGIKDGAQSLLGNTAAGVFNGVSKVTGGLADGIAFLIPDDKYMQKRQQLKQKRQENVDKGIQTGAQTIYAGFEQGISGLYRLPLNGAQQGGLTGFFVGGFQGIIGLVLKPIAGILETVSFTAQGIQHMAKNETRLQSQNFRAQRIFYGQNKYIKQYNEFEANISQMIRAIIMNNEFDISFIKIFNIGDGLLLILTVDFIIVLNRNNQTIDLLIESNYVKHISQGIKNIKVMLQQSTIYHQNIKIELHIEDKNLLEYIYEFMLETYEFKIYEEL